MSFLQSMVSFQLGWLIASLVVILSASLLVLWISTFLGRQWFANVQKSEETVLMTAYLARIADALERLAPTPQPRIELAEAHAPQAEPASNGNTSRPLGMSMFGL